VSEPTPAAASPTSPSPAHHPRRPDPPDLGGLYCTDCRACAYASGPIAPVGARTPVGIAAEKPLRPGNQWFRGRPRDPDAVCDLCMHTAERHVDGLDHSGLAVGNPAAPFAGEPGDALVFRLCRTVLADEAPGIAIDSLVNVAFFPDGVRVGPARHGRSTVRRPLEAVIGVRATGSGSRSTDFGVFGFGSTITGFATAVAASSLINAASTNVTVECFIHVAIRTAGAPAEWIFATTAFEPLTVERALHPFNRAAANAAPPTADDPPGESKVDQLHKLADLRDRGVVTAEEFDELKREILDDD
jgi:hypothetical protein